MKNSIYRGLTLPLQESYRIIRGKKNSEYSPVNNQEVMDKIGKTITIVKDCVKWGINTPQNAEYYKAINSGAHPETGEQLPTNLNEQARILNHKYQEYLPKEMKGKSIVERMIGHNLLELESAFGKKLKAIHGEEYISQGWVRTINSVLPQPSARINIGSTNNVYSSQKVEENKIILDMICYDNWYRLIFTIPENYQKTDYSKISKPLITLNDQGEMKFYFSFEYDRYYPEISDQYVIGVDVGVVKPIVLSVIEIKTGRIVASHESTPLIDSLVHDIKQTQEQITNLYKKVEKYIKNGDYPAYDRAMTEIQQERLGLSRKRKEMAKRIGQFVSDIACAWGDPVIAVEDLGWVRNTMQNGRWNRGEIVNWVEHYANLDGRLCYRVNAAHTSSTCCLCGSKGYFSSGRVFNCSSCGEKIDRDENAAANIGKRVINSALKSSKTRKKRRKEKCITEQSKRRSPVNRGAKNRPTPVRPAKKKKKTVLKRQEKVKDFGSCTKGSMGFERADSSKNTLAGNHNNLTITQKE